MLQTERGGNAASHNCHKHRLRPKAIDLSIRLQLTLIKSATLFLIRDIPNANFNEPVLDIRY